tara:strand:+ start:8357 stop:9322 length:966 start_codon:yes stop_codon:yes gene_type:complete
MKKKIIIITGDPNSINSELIYKCWKKIDNKLKKKIYLISNIELLKEQFKILKYRIKIVEVKNLNECYNNKNLKILNLDLKFTNPFKVSLAAGTKFVHNSLNLGHELGLKKEVMGIINCPIDKKFLNKNNLGVTEYLASKCSVKEENQAMLIMNEKLMVCPLTTHINLQNVSKKINKLLIVNKIKTIDLWFKKKFRKKPKFAILGLNPHNSEFNKASKENKIIIPAVKTLKNLKINIRGPIPADTIFINDYKKFNIIVGMYHDQVLAPFKALYKFNAINLTAGLRYLRVSPDHGVAIDLIKKNKSKATSLLKCIKIINKFGR